MISEQWSVICAQMNGGGGAMRLELLLEHWQVGDVAIGNENPLGDLR